MALQGAATPAAAAAATTTTALEIASSNFAGESLAPLQSLREPKSSELNQMPSTMMPGPRQLSSAIASGPSASPGSGPQALTTTEDKAHSSSSFGIGQTSHGNPSGVTRPTISARDLIAFSRVQVRLLVKDCMVCMYLRVCVCGCVCVREEGDGREAVRE